MKTIASFVDREYFSISILESMRQVGQWLKERDYYAVIDECGQTVGIVTVRDFLIDQNNLVINCNLCRPVVQVNDSLVDVWMLMIQLRYEYLPVFEADCFIGVISLWVVNLEVSKLVLIETTPAASPSH